MTEVLAPGRSQSIDDNQRLALLRQVPVASSLSDDVLAELAGALGETRVEAGIAVVTEGDPGDTLYVIVDGRVEVSIAAGHAGGEPVPIATMGPGELFGEYALLDDEARRQATVTALTPLTLLTLDRATFQRLLLSRPEIRAAVERGAREMVVLRFLKQASPFGALDPARLRELGRHLTQLAVPTGTEIIRIGEPGDACYLLQRGSVEAVAPTEDGGERRLMTLSAGSLFGEAALLTDAPRNATVRAIEDAELLVLSREDFISVVNEDRRVRSAVVGLLELRDRPRQVEGVEAFHRETPSGEVVTTLRHAGRGIYYRVSPQGWFVWQRLDGQHTLRDLTMGYLAEFKVFAPQAVADIIAGLSQARLVEGQRLRSDVATAADAQSGWSRVVGRVRRVMEWYVTLRNVDGFFSRWYDRFVRYLFHPVALAIMTVIALAGLAAFAATAGRIGDAVRDNERGAALLLFFIPAFILSLLLHELGHAFATKHYGREVRGIGVGWYWYGPVAFIDTTDMWLAARRPRIVVNLAGLAVDMVLAGAAALAAWQVNSDIAAAALWQFALSSYIAVLVNLNPLMEYDGYFVLIDSIERPNLRPKVMAWLGRELVPTLRRRGLAGLAGRRLELLYGSASLFYVATMAVVTVVLYRLLVQRWLDTLLPGVVAEGLAWFLAALVILLSAIGIMGDLRGGRFQPTGRAT